MVVRCWASWSSKPETRPGPGLESHSAAVMFPRLLTVQVMSDVWSIQSGLRCEHQITGIFLDPGRLTLNELKFFWHRKNCAVFVKVLNRFFESLTGLQPAQDPRAPCHLACKVYELWAFSLSEFFAQFSVESAYYLSLSLGARRRKLLLSTFLSQLGHENSKQSLRQIFDLI